MPTCRLPALWLLLHILQLQLNGTLLHEDNSLLGGIVYLQYFSVQHDLDCSPRTRRDEPSTLQLTLLLQHHGGSAKSPFTAVSHKEALANFRNLIPLVSTDKNEQIHLKFNTYELQDMLEKYYSAKSLQQEEKFQLPSHFLQQLIPANLARFNTTVRQHRQSLDFPGQRTYFCNDSMDCRDFDNTSCFNGETEEVLDDDDCLTCRCKDPDTINGYCLNISQDEGLSHVHLCTQCQKAGNQGPDAFPSYIQEVFCHPDSLSCMDLAHHGPQGACKDTHIPIDVLRRIPGRCMKISIASGQSLQLDDWRMTQMLIRTGCQCMLDKRSALLPILT